jgi:hypothetical protein
VGVALNGVAAGGAWWLASRAVEEPEVATPVGSRESGTGIRKDKKDKRPSGSRIPDPVSRQESPWLAALGFGASGFASLTLQVVWTRLLVQILGPTTYAFSTVVAIFIIGIAGGAAIGSRLARAHEESRRRLACSMLLSAGLALAAASRCDWALLTIGGIVSRPDTSSRRARRESCWCRAAAADDDRLRRRVSVRVALAGGATTRSPSTSA